MLDLSNMWPFRLFFRRLRIRNVDIVDAGMIILIYSDGLNATFTLRGKMIDLKIRTVSSHVLLDYSQSTKKLTLDNFYLDSLEGRWIKVPMDSNRASQYVAVAKKYLHRHYRNDYQCSRVLPRIYTALRQIPLPLGS